MDDLEFCQKLPKVELHAHLNGSVRPSTLLDLAKNRSSGDRDNKGGGGLSEAESVVISEGSSRTLEQCFEMFQIVHRIVDTIGAVERIAEEMVIDCARDGVVYLELRTTPKWLVCCTKRAYMNAVFRGISEALDQKVCRNMVNVGVLLSIDRGRDDLKSALETVDLALSLRDSGKNVVGIDISGNPNVGSVLDFIPAFVEARSSGLKVVVHLAEVENGGTVEALDLFNRGMMPDRIGHGVFLEGHACLLTRGWNIPIEMCLTSNMKTQSCSSYADHHILDWLLWSHPVCLCTDDSGIFSTTLSHECFLALSELNLDQSRILAIQRDAARMAFCSDSKRNHILALLDEFESCC